MKSHAKRTPAKKSAPAAGAGQGELSRSCLLAACVALCVARPLLPSEGVSWLGDGQPFNLLWLVVAAGYLLLAVARGRLARPLDLVDLCVAAMVLICAASALVSAQSTPDARELGLTGNGNPRASINMLFEWVSLGLVFFLTRQLVRTPREARALVAIMVALAVVLAAYGFYQVFVSFPATRAEYAQNPDPWYPPGSPERLRFESRLQSSEPFATFALTNSLAGFLAPWLVIALGIAMRVAQNGRGAVRWSSTIGFARLAGLCLCLVAVAACLVLTKSRSAYVALALTVPLLPFATRAGRQRFNWKFALVGAAILLAVVGAAVAFKGLDAAVVTEASKSLGYRLQYWQSTLAMIARYHWLGVGPGSFQDYYTQFKLPQASEEVRDPHNFLLEVWATAGTFALVALCAVLGLFAFRVCARRATSPEGETTSPAEPSVAASTTTVRFMAAGAAAGFVIAFLIGPPLGLALPEGQLVAGLLVGGAVMAMLWPWVAGGTLPPRLPALGVLALAIHLLASGGIAFPAVADTFWMLLALGLNQADEDPGAGHTRRKNGGDSRFLRPLLAVAFGIATSAAAACYFSAYRPVIACRAAMAEAEAAPDEQTRVRAYLEAAKADPLSADPWTALAELEIGRLRHDRRAVRAFQDFAAATERILALRGHSSSVWRQAGQWYSEVYGLNRDPEAANMAVDCLRNAVELYPNLASLRGEYALALQAIGQSDAARRHADKALELDRETPHPDKKLPANLKGQLAPLVGGP